ncbi:tripartite tricarboxylate transporter TctB family protein [Dongia deserti]|uniref:tripartite tricarboxylate transporter TctB family protein n=1 Tax=Dongia deserti TaxID=2268030 RepID=UPI000E655B37|nr:tripartite tricarboxylate transporter TctB family protein [Dongia deserti]
MNANSKDLSAGLLFIAIAALFAFQTRDLDMGTPLRLGPGAFPLLLAGVLALLGLIIVLQAFRNPVTHSMTIPWRGIVLIVLAPIVFGLTVRGLGLVASIALVVLISAYASRRMHLKLATLLTIGLTLFCVLVFSIGLGLPLRLVGSWLRGLG